jgi:hypothetical protein
MTLRRLFVLLKGLPPDSMFKVEVEVAAAKANRPSVEQIRARQAYYNQQREGAS